jgi:ferric-dicitrate binding protein FerR (iron transport regulator)
MSTDSRTASPSPLTPASLLADRAALKQVFDAEYDSCLAAAKTQLADAPNLASRVVENAFLNVWNKRVGIGTNQQLKAALSEEIRHGSARALSRRASAGRFAGGKTGTTGQHAATETSKAEVWSHIERALQGPGTDPHAAAADASRHEAAKQMKTVAKRPSWLIPVVIGVIALAVSLGGMLYVDRLGEDDAMLSVVNNAGIQPIASNVGQIGSVVLGDSSSGETMKMGPETRVFIPDHFPEKVHVLKVDGTASFDIAPVKSGGLPFRVVAKRVHVIAIGTSFAVSAYSNDSGVAVLVKKGSVTVKVGKVSNTVGENQAVIVDSAIRPATDAERAERLGWVDGTMTIANKPLREVVATLARWGFDAKVPDLTLLDRPASISVPFDSTGHPVIKEHMDQVEKSANVKLGSEGTNWVLRDAAGAPAEKAAPAKGKAKAAAPPKPAGKKKKK